MVQSTKTRLMTSEEMFALPDEPDVERWLIREELHERRVPPDEAGRNPDHCLVTANLTFELMAWSKKQPEPRGAVCNGEVYFRLSRNPETNVGIDVAYASPELVGKTPRGAKFFDGAPTLAAEVLSPSDTLESIDTKVREYLTNGVRLVWIVDAVDRTVTIYRPGQEPVMVNIEGELTGDPDLPGLRIPAKSIFPF